MREAVRNYLNAEVTDWYHQGIIGQETRALLAERYDRQGSALSTLIKWLGFFAVYSLGSFVLTFVAAMAQSKTAAAVILFLAAGGSWHTGVRLVRRFPVSYTYTGSLLITVALAALYGALYLTLDVSSVKTAITLVYAVALAAAGTAYYYRLRWPLVLTLLLFFHGVRDRVRGPLAVARRIARANLLDCVAVAELSHDRLIARGGSVERQVSTAKAARLAKLFLAFRKHHGATLDDLEIFGAPTTSFRAEVDLLQRPRETVRGREVVENHPVGDLAGESQHLEPHRREVDGHGSRGEPLEAKALASQRHAGEIRLLAAQNSSQHRNGLAHARERSLEWQAVPPIHHVGFDFLVQLLETLRKPRAPAGDRTVHIRWGGAGKSQTEKLRPFTRPGTSGDSPTGAEWQAATSQGLDVYSDDGTPVGGAGQYFRGLSKGTGSGIGASVFYQPETFPDPKSCSGGQTSDVALLHELQHALHMVQGSVDNTPYSSGWWSQDPLAARYGVHEEKFAVERENEYRTALRQKYPDRYSALRPRQSYLGDC